MSARDLVNQLDEIQSCFDAVADLMIPEGDLTAVRRDKVSVLLAYLNARQSSVLVELAKAASEGIGKSRLHSV